MSDYAIAMDRFARPQLASHPACHTYGGASMPGRFGVPLWWDTPMVGLCDQCSGFRVVSRVAAEADLDCLDEGHESAIGGVHIAQRGHVAGQ